MIGPKVNNGMLCLVALAIFVMLAPAAKAQDLPDRLPPIPNVPAPKPPASVPLGDPKDFPEVKADFPIARGPFDPTWESINRNYHGEPEWLRGAKFGIWVHFGPQSAGQSGDWYARKLYQPKEQAYANHLRDFGHPSETGYMEVLHRWNPTKLDPASLVQIYHDAGARFLIVQGVHSDNFDNWNSKYQPWNSVNMGPHRDLVGEWSKATKAAGMRYGISFHHEYTWWWMQTAFGADVSGDKAGVPYDAARLTLADGKGQWWEGYDPRLLYTINLREYQGIDTLRYCLDKGIFTNHQEFGKWYTTQWALRILDAVEKYDPDFIYTDGNSTQPFSGNLSGAGTKSDAGARVVASFFNRSLQKRGKLDSFAIVKFHPPTNGVVNTVETAFPPAIKSDQPWIGENAVGDWFYAPNYVYDAGAVVRCLLEYVSRDGNYALCVALQPDGSLDEGSRAMLQRVGEWMSVNGAGIYGSRAWKVFGEGANGKIRSLPAGQLGRSQADFQFTPQDFRFTVGSDGAVYAFCMAMPKAGSTIKIVSLGTGAKLLDHPVKSVSLLGSDEHLTWTQRPDGLAVTCPHEMPLSISATFRVE